MLRLLKYEFLKARATHLVLLGVTLADQLVFFMGILTREVPAVTITLILQFFLSIAGTAWVGLNCILTLHRDIRSRQSYMLFMTDRSCFGILGAKLIQTTVMLVFFAGLYVGMGYLNIDIFLRTFSRAEGVWIGLNGLLEAYAYVNLMDGTLLTTGFVTYAATWLSYIAAGCFADVLANVWLPGKRLPVIVAFLIFGALAYVINWTQTLLPALPVYQQSLLLATGLSMAYVAALYLATAFLMERKLSL